MIKTDNFQERLKGLIMAVYSRFCCTFAANNLEINVFVVILSKKQEK